MIEYSLSIYFVTKYMLVVDKITKLYKLNPSDVFRQDKVVLSLPDILFYNQTLPWVYKARCDE